MSERSEIPSKIKALREKSGLTVRELARRLDVPLGTYANYETQRTKRPYLAMEWAEKLADAYEGTPVSREEVMAHELPRGCRQEHAETNH